MVRDGLFTDGDSSGAAGQPVRQLRTDLFPRSDTCPTAPPRTPSRSSCHAGAAVGLDGGHRAAARLRRRGPLRDRRRRAARGHPGHHAPDRERPGGARRGPGDGAPRRAAAHRRRGQRRRDLRLRPGGRRVSCVVVAGVGMHPFGRFDGVSTTDMGVRRRPHRAAGSGRRQRRLPGRLLRDRLRRRGHRPQGPQPARHDGHAHRRRRSRLRQRRRRPHAGGRPHPGRPVRHRARLRHREDAQGHHPLLVLRAVAGGGGPGRHARVLRPAGAAARP